MENDVSRPATLDDLKKLVEALNKENADYILIGGYALYAHGLYRTTTDIDILVPPNEESGKKVINALLVLPDRAARDIDVSWFEEKDTIRLADEIVVDIMFNAAGETYESLKKYMEVIKIDGIPVKTINLEGLLLTKNTFREKDLTDKKLLKSILNEINKS
ncbi:MAG: nucleotidyltransferase family protein [Elusimicrobia bacterium]|nr:nucleotidyltransferase family protein [Candidatus Liberimonas magnetica]